MFSTIVCNTQDIDRLQFVDLISAPDLIADQAAAVKHEPVIHVRLGSRLQLWQRTLWLLSNGALLSIQQGVDKTA